MATIPVEEDLATARQKEQEQFKTKCDNYVSRGLDRNMTIKFLLEKLVSLGCAPPSNFIRCMDCGDKQAGGGFGMIEETVISSDNVAANEDAQRRISLPQCQRSMKDLQNQLSAEKSGTSELKLVPEIFLCQQHVRDETHAHESMAHELIHAIDMCRTNMDPMHNCVQLACTEIRAENLSGECSQFKEFISGRINEFPKHAQRCVKRRAALSVQANPNCKDRSHEYVEAAFERCFADTYPFDRHPNLK